MIETIEELFAQIPYNQTKAPGGKQEKVERILFVMPSNPEMFLAALAAVEAYEDIRLSEQTYAQINGAIYFEYELVLSMREDLEFLVDKKKFKCIRNLANDRSGSIWDLEVWMDPVRATSLAAITNRSLVEGFSLMIGGLLKTIFPTMIRNNEDLKDQPAIIFVLDEKGPKVVWDNLVELLEKNFPNYKVLRNREVYYEHYQTLFNVVKNSAAVIGYRSFETYLAAAMKKVVIEVNDGPYKNWLAKFEDPYYSMVWREIGSALPNEDLLYSAFRARWKACNLDGRIKADGVL